MNDDHDDNDDNANDDDDNANDDDNDGSKSHDICDDRPEE